jgi:hypothetical protein
MEIGLPTLVESLLENLVPIHHEKAMLQKNRLTADELTPSPYYWRL